MPAPNELPEAVIERVIAAMRKGPQKLWRCDLVSDQISVERMTEIVTFALRAAGDGREAKDAARFRALQDMPPAQAQAFFWNYASRKQRAAAIDTAMGAGQEGCDG